jgi:hypothetical protein
MSNSDIARVRYYTRQFLRTADFVDEQAYHVAMQRRHNLAGHTWGIIRGLDVEQDKDARLAVSAGAAIDGYGRYVILPAPQSIEQGEFDQRGSEVLDVWLVYSQQDGAPAPDGYLDCGLPADSAPGRTQEFGKVIVRPPNPRLVRDPVLGTPAHRQPDAVPESDLDFAPFRVPPDDPAQSWPIFLGQIQRNKGGQVPYTIDPTGRPYAGLVGEQIKAPSGLAWVQVGTAEDDDARSRFAVFLHKDRCVDPAAAPLPRLAIDEDGRIDLRGETTVYGDLTIDGGAVEFNVGYAETPQPWRVYRVQYAGKDVGFDELRIEMAAPAGGPKKRNQVVIGAWSDQQSKFVPCLTIADDCSVTVQGNLTVQGKFDKPVVPAPPTAEALAMSRGALFTGLAGGVNAFQTAVVPAPPPPTPEERLNALGGMLDALAPQVAGDPAFARAVATQLAERISAKMPAVRDTLRAALAAPPPGRAAAAAPRRAAARRRQGPPPGAALAPEAGPKPEPDAGAAPAGDEAAEEGK